MTDMIEFRGNTIFKCGDTQILKSPEGVCVLEVLIPVSGQLGMYEASRSQQLYPYEVLCIIEGTQKVLDRVMRMEGRPPCDNCCAVCCRETGGRRFAVSLEADEDYSDAVDLGPDGRVIPYVEGACAYLNKSTNLCKIYGDRPKKCREFNCMKQFRPNGEPGFFLQDNPKVIGLITGRFSQLVTTAVESDGAAGVC